MWLKLLMFLVVNGPALIQFIKEIIDIFDGDKKEAMAALKEMPSDIKKAAEAGDFGPLRKFAKHFKEKRGKNVG